MAVPPGYYRGLPGRVSACCQTLTVKLVPNWVMSNITGMNCGFCSVVGRQEIMTFEKYTFHFDKVSYIVLF